MFSVFHFCRQISGAKDFNKLQKLPSTFRDHSNFPLRKIIASFEAENLIYKFFNLPCAIFQFLIVNFKFPFCFVAAPKIPLDTNMFRSKQFDFLEKLKHLLAKSARKAEIKFCAFRNLKFLVLSSCALMAHVASTNKRFTVSRNSSVQESSVCLKISFFAGPETYNRKLLACFGCCSPNASPKEKELFEN